MSCYGYFSSELSVRVVQRLSDMSAYREHSLERPHQRAYDGSVLRSHLEENAAPKTPSLLSRPEQAELPQEA
jgi:hypothetical protein